MKVSVILVGPWNRVSQNNIPLKSFVEYVSLMRKNENVLEIIYSSTDPEGVVKGEYFNKVCSNHHLLSSITDTPHLYFENSKEGINQAKGEYVLKLRSDLYLKEIDFVIQSILSSEEKIVIDYHIDHTLLIPYYYSDFMFGSKTCIAGTLFNKTMVIKHSDKKHLLLSPFKFLTAGLVPEEFKYGEVLIWSCMLMDTEMKMCDFTFSNYIHSLKTLRKSFILLSREDIFFENSKYNYKTRNFKYIFKKKILNFNVWSITVLFAHHNYLYLSRTLILINRLRIRKYECESPQV